MCPWNAICEQRVSSFSFLSLIVFSQHLVKNLSRFSSCSWSSLPWIIISSAIHKTPGKPSRAWHRRFWNISLETFKQKGSLTHLYLPNGVMKVVSKLDSSSSDKCQNANERSTFEKTLALDNSGNISSSTDNWYRSLLRASLSGLGSMQILTSPDFFIVATNWLVHSVGWSTGAKASSTTSLSNYVFSSSRTLMDTERLGNVTGIA